jgi:prepilin-type N-terminal cleavage/methylation domain-containing protein
MPRRNRAPSLHSGGFTLVELLLAVALLALLLAAVAFNFSSLQQGQALEQGASQFESLLRLARAHAALSGHNVLVALVPASASTAGGSSQDPVPPDAMALAVLAQPDPLRNPSLLDPIPGATALLPSLAELIQIEVPLPQGNPLQGDAGPGPGPGLGLSSSNNVPDASNPSPYPPAAGSQAPGLSSVQSLLTFRPDGSANATSFTLVSTDPDDTRRLLLAFDPVSVSFQRRIVSASASTNDAVVVTDEEVPEDITPEATKP